jgi:U3 small nucleolar RNA-associated protein 13
LSLSEDGRILAASLGEEVLFTDLTNGKELGRIEGDGEVITALACECHLHVGDMV